MKGYTPEPGRLYFALIGACTGLVAAFACEIILLSFNFFERIQNSQISSLILPVIETKPKTESRNTRVEETIQTFRTIKEVYPKTNCFLVDGEGKFGTMDIRTGVFTQIAKLDYDLGDIAWDLNKHLYAVGSKFGELDTQQHLFRIDTTNFHFEDVGLIHGAYIAGLVFSPKGRLLGATQEENKTSGRLIDINVKDGTWKELLDFSPYATSGDLDFDAKGDLYVTVLPRDDNSLDSPDSLLRLKPEERKFEVVGSLGVPGVKGLARGPDNIMYGFSFHNKELLKIDVKTAKTEHLFNFGGIPLDESGGSSFANQTIVIDKQVPVTHKVFKTVVVTTVKPKIRQLYASLIAISIWMGLIGVSIIFSLNVAQFSYFKPKSHPGILLAGYTSFGGLAFAFTGAIGQSIFSIAPIAPWLFITVLLHLFGSLIMGLFLRIAIPKVILNVSEHLTLIVLSLGFVTASFFQQEAIWGKMGTSGRFCAAFILGFAVGVLIENISDEKEEHNQKPRLPRKPILASSNNASKTGSLSKR